jgi:hypothetical protein
MNKISKCILMGFVALATCVSSAIYAVDTDDLFDGSHRVFAGVGMSHDKTKQAGETTSGNPVEMTFGYDYNNHDGLYMFLKMSWNAGQFNGKMDSKDYRSFNHGIELESRLGWYFCMEQDIALIPYIGLGYNYDRIAIKKTTGINGGKIKSRGYYFPVGILAEWQFMPEFSIGLDVQAKFMFNTRMAVPKNIIGTSDAEIIKGKKMINWVIEMPLVYDLNEDVDLSLIPYYEMSEFKPRATSTFLGSNIMKSREYGARIEVGYNF